MLFDVELFFQKPQISFHFVLSNENLLNVDYVMHDNWVACFKT